MLSGPPACLFSYGLLPRDCWMCEESTFLPLIKLQLPFHNSLAQLYESRRVCFVKGMCSYSALILCLGPRVCLQDFQMLTFNLFSQGWLHTHNLVVEGHTCYALQTGHQGDLGVQLILVYQRKCVLSACETQWCPSNSGKC